TDSNVIQPKGQGVRCGLRRKPEGTRKVPSYARLPRRTSGTLPPPARRSCAVASNVKTAPAGSLVSMLAFAGRLSIGAVVSVTVTAKDAAALFPCPSVALQATFVAPTGNVTPLAGVQLIATPPSRISAADAA